MHDIYHQKTDTLSLGDADNPDTAGMRMKPIHLAEVLAVLDTPGKITCPPFAVTNLIYAGGWEEVQSACEIDVISIWLLLARWRCLTDPRAEPHQFPGDVDDPVVVA